MTVSAVRASRRPLALLLAAVPLLSACLHAPVAGGAATDADAAEAPPLLQLGRDVRPLAYRLHLEVDPSAERFAGTVEIDVSLDRPRRVIWLHGQGLAVASATATPAGGVPVAARYEQVNEEGLARLALAAPLPPGRATLRLAWSAAFGTLAGLYRTGDEAARYASTQFEAADARRCFPGFDDPGFKTPFEVVLTVPEGLVAVSNAPEAARAPAGPGRARLRFQPTAPLPTYLVFVGVGPFEVVEVVLPPTAIRPHPLPVRALGPRGRARELEWPLEVANRLLLDLEDWFGMPFPYPKLDHVAVADFAFGAMENAGAIAYAAPWFLVPPGQVGEAHRRDIAELIAHELSHQWFGDLVTLPWWTETWLNESFGTWMGIRATARVEPGWRKELDLSRAATWAMAADGLAAAEPIRQPLVRMAGVMAQFDVLRYSKGAAVLHMLERWVGQAPFRDAIRRYLSAHAHGTGSTPELLAELSRAAGRDVAALASTFLDQPGVPLVEAHLACDGGGARVALSQSRWRPRGAEAVPDGRWQVPVCLRYRTEGADRERCALLDGDSAEVVLPEGCPEWLLPDAGGAGYYRWTLPPAQLAALLRSGLPRLTTAEKLSLGQSAVASQQAGTLPYPVALDALAVLSADPDPAVAELPFRFLGAARESLVPDASVADVDQVIGRLYGPALARLGWTPRAGEPADDAVWRGTLIELLTSTGSDPALLDEGARRGARLLGLETGRPDPDAVAPELIPSAVGALLRRQGARGVAAILDRLAEASPTLRAQLLEALAWADGPATGAVVALWREPRLLPGERFQPYWSLSWRRATRGELLAAVERDVDAMLAALPEGEDVSFPAFLRGLCSVEDAARVRALLTPRLASHPGMTKALGVTLSAVSQCAARREADGAAAGEAYRALAARLEAAPGGGPSPAPRRRRRPSRARAARCRASPACRPAPTA